MPVTVTGRFLLLGNLHFISVCYLPDSDLSCQQDVCSDDAALLLNNMTFQVIASIIVSMGMQLLFHPIELRPTL